MSSTAPGATSGTKSTHRPTGGHFKEISEDNLTDWAAALTYYGVLAMFPAIIALVSIVALVFDPQQIVAALTGILNTIAPGTAAQTFSGVIEQIAGSQSAAGFGLVLGIAGALWAASGYVGAFTRAANVVWESGKPRRAGRSGSSSPCSCWSL